MTLSEVDGLLQQIERESLGRDLFFGGFSGFSEVCLGFVLGFSKVSGVFKVPVTPLLGVLWMFYMFKTILPYVH